MEATDLMIGDWVKCTDPKCEGHQVDLIDLANEEVGLDGEIDNFENIIPIPLTPEILEKNGFVCVTVGDNGIGTPPKFRNRYEKWECRTQWHTFSVFYDRITHRFSINARYSNHIEGMLYVHELQHAIRISGIDKEVVV